MNKKIKTTFFSTLLLGVLCAGTVSARQLQTKANIQTCTGTCSAIKPCAGPCICQIFSGTTGGCVRDPGPVRR
jgi:hypothetical protein